MVWSVFYQHPTTDKPLSLIAIQTRLLDLCVFVPADPCNKSPSHLVPLGLLVPWHLELPRHSAIW